MKYQKTIDIWKLQAESPDEISKLQPGQWVTAGGSKGIYCGLREPSKSVVVMWYGNAKGRDYAAYRKTLMNYAKGK